MKIIDIHKNFMCSDKRNNHGYTLTIKDESDITIIQRFDTYSLVQFNQSEGNNRKPLRLFYKNDDIIFDDINITIW